MSEDSCPRQSFFVVRQDEKTLPAVPLPFYASSTGISAHESGQSEHTGRILNQFVKITWLLSGTYETLISDRKQQIGKGAVFYTLYGEERYLRCVSEWGASRWLCIDGPFAEAFLLAFRYPRIQTAGSYPERQFAELDEIMGDDSPEQIRRKSCLVMEIIAAMAGNDDTLYPTERLVRKCIAMIRSNIANPDFSLEQLCDELAVSRATLNRLFRKTTHFSPGRYLLNERMSRATSLLTGSDLPIEEIAARCGFRSRPTFSRFIRRSKKVSPQEYRKNFLAGSSTGIPPAP